MCFITISWFPSLAKKKIIAFSEAQQATWAYLELTTACNLDCGWCFSAQKLNSSKKMSEDELSHVLSLLVNSGIKQITFGGGEPLLYPNLVDWVSWLTQRGIIVNINSNGFFLTQELANRFAKAGLNQFQTNIESIDEKKHDQIRGGKGAHQHAIQAIDFALKAGINVVSQVVVTKENMDNIPDILKFSKQLGVHRSRLWDMTPSGNALENGELLPDNYPQLLYQVAELAVTLGALEIQSYEPLFPSVKTLPIPITHVPCPSRKGLLINIGVNGAVNYCSTFRRELYNIFDVDNGETLSLIHRDSINSYTEAQLPLSNTCLNCNRLPICNGGCPSRMVWANGFDYQCNYSS